MLDLTPERVARLDGLGPRYTSYPTADRMAPDFGPSDLAEALARADAACDAPLSVYVHLPHCARVCGYCACNVVGSKRPEVRAAYVARVLAELSLVARHLPRRRRLGQLHFGGGTPNSYALSDLVALKDAITARFVPEPDAELAIELDPRHASAMQLDALRAAGWTRISFGVQDLDADVQLAIGRLQSARQTSDVVRWARAAGFGSVNIDLVYGLPLQTRASFEATLSGLLDLGPDRVALFSFAFLPAARVNQRRILPEMLPEPEAKLAMLVRARERLLAAGYVAVGMDHFARPSDALAEAAAAGRLARNFQGYTVGTASEAALEVVGLGLSAISDLGGALTQSAHEPEAWAEAVDAGRLPVARGLTRTREDELRGAVIADVMTGRPVTREALRQRFGEDAGRLLDARAAALGQLEVEGLVTPARGGFATGFALTPLGALFPRRVAMAFDAHLRSEDRRFSRLV